MLYVPSNFYCFICFKDTFGDEDKRQKHDNCIIFHLNQVFRETT